MMSILIEQLINITDAIFLGHIGEIELGASALAGIWYLAIYMLGLGFSQGLQVVIARRNGEKHYSETGKTFFQGLFFLSGLAVFLCLFFKLFSPMILSQLITSPKVYHAVIDYLDWRIWGLLFSFPFLALRSFLVGITQTRALTIAALSAVLVNILGNWMLIFLLDMGIAGAAIASSVAELCSLAILSIHIQNMNKQPYGLYWQFDKNILFRVCRISAWSMFHSFISVAPWFLFFVAIEHLGELQLAVANIIRSISTLFFVIVNSFSSTASSLISNMIGAKERKCVFPLCNQIIRLGYAIGFPFITLALIFNQPNQCIHKRPNRNTNCMASIYSNVAELCICIARICLHKRCNRNRSDTNCIYLSVNDNYNIYIIPIWAKPLECTFRHLLDCRIPVRNRTWYPGCHLSQI